MTIEAIRDTIVTTFHPAFALAQPTVVQVYENQRFHPPTNGNWIYVMVVPSTTKRANIGNTLEFNSWGTITIQIMIKEEGGSADAREIMDAAFKILGDRTLAIPGGGKVTVEGMDVSPRHVLNGWFCYNVVFPYKARITLVR